VGAGAVTGTRARVTIVRRVAFVGVSCSGKSTSARRLAAKLGLPYVELDELNHGPGWTEVSANELQARVERTLAAAPDGWVVEPTYSSKLGELIYERAGALVWLDLPLVLCLRRIWKRTWRRILRGEELWHGNRETIRNAFFVRNSLFRGAIDAHRRNATAVPARAARHEQLRLIRLRSADDVERFLATL
jgi:adenylate kinase family enzyme